MATRRKPPKLRLKDGCYVANFYRPDGKRSTISFGPVGPRTEGQIHVAFGKWLDLFHQNPHKVLSFKSPYDAIEQMINPQEIIAVGELVDKYIEWFEQHAPKRPDGRENPDVERLKRLKRFLEPYLRWPASSFGPEELYAVQKALVEYRYRRGEKEVGYTRGSINKLISYVSKMWRWGIGREVTTEAQAQRLREVKPLRIGRSAAKDKLKRALVSEDELEKVTENLTGVVADMLRLIWITAMRPSEVCRMRPFDILHKDRSCWLYVPGRDASMVGDHKTAHHQRIRAVPLPASAQAILKPRIEDFGSKEFIFTPVQAIQELLERKAANRKTPLNQGNRPGTNRREHPMITPGDRYSAHSFYGAVKRACERAGVERFTPYDLRRTAATRIRALLSKDAAKLILGHVSTDTTEIYLLDEVQEAMKVAKRLDAGKG